jgi:DNA-directed RNA polymerase specialized sigma24 family protein
VYYFGDKTSIGGSKEGFETTCWTDIQLISSKINAPQKIISNLTERYWKPVYCYLRQKGCDNELAKDLTQGFFQKIVLDSNFIQQADQLKGRFRKYLLTALNHYVSDWFRKESTKKRSPRSELLDPINDNLEDKIVSPGEVGPEQVFNYSWASNVLDRVLKKVRKDCHASGKKLHWKVFYARVLLPIFNETKIISVKEIKEKYNIENEQTISNMIVTVKRMFKTALEQQLRLSVQSDSEIDDEINELKKAISIKNPNTNIPVYINGDEPKF